MMIVTIMLSDTHNLVHLHRQLPLRVSLDILDALIQDKIVSAIVPHIAWLQIAESTGNAMVADLMFAIEYQLQFIYLLHYRFPTLGEIYLWRTGNPVDTFRNGMGSVGFHRKIITSLMKSCYKLLINLQRRFATRKDDESAFATLFQAFGQDVVCTHLPVATKIGIAERAFQVASAHPDEHCRSAHPSAFTLQRIEYFVNFIHFQNLYGIKFSMPFIFSSSITTAVFPKLSCTLAL